MTASQKPSSVAERRLAIARRLHEALVAQNPNRTITLCDTSGLWWLATSRVQNQMIGLLPIPPSDDAELPLDKPRDPLPNATLCEIAEH